MRYPFKQKKSKPSNDTGLKAGALENDLAHSSPGLKAQGFSEQDYKNKKLIESSKVTLPLKEKQ